MPCVEHLVRCQQLPMAGKLIHVTPNTVQRADPEASAVHNEDKRV